MKKATLLFCILALLLTGCTRAKSAAGAPAETVPLPLPTVQKQEIPSTQATEQAQQTVPAPEETTQPPTVETKSPTLITTPATAAPTQQPTAKPTQRLTQAPTQEPTTAPTRKPTQPPTQESVQPTQSAKPANTGDIWFTQDTITLTERSSTLLQVNGDISGDYVTYTSSNESVVKMYGEFLLAPLYGTAVVTATHAGRTAQITVIVERDPSIQRVHINQDTLTLRYNPGKLNWYSYDVDWATLVWSSSDETVARVDQEGMVYPGKVGQCTITLSDGVNFDTCTVTVKGFP